jgi:4-amino-4-deoxy-L-arabinose transferase-like glycosyltransferase
MSLVAAPSQPPSACAPPGAPSKPWPWHLLALGAIALLAAGLNLWGLQRVGYGNAYYASAVLSMLQSWHNLFFLSFDPGGFVSVDKPPLGFWIQAASAKLLGFSGLSILLPEALAGIGSVILLYHLVRRAFGTGTGLLAALMLAFTPVSVSVSRNNTIDSLLVFTLLLAAWSAMKAAETGRLRCLLLTGFVVGLGFEIKMLEAYLVVPALGLLYLLAAPRRWPVRIGHLALATVVMLTTSFAWPVAVDLTPANQRPWVDSTQDNSAVDLALGYNGIQRLLGRGASVGPGGGGFGPGGEQENGAPGPLRLIDQQLGVQASWLLTLSLAGLVVSGTIGWRTRRWLSASRRGQAFVLWGMWLLAAGTFFSVAEYFHSYYLVTLGPPVAALAAIGVSGAWRALRSGAALGWLLPVALVGGTLLQLKLLAPYVGSSYGWLPSVATAAALLSAVVLAAVCLLRRGISVAFGAAVVGVTALLLAPSVWAAIAAMGQGGGMLPSAVGPVVGDGARGSVGGFARTAPSPGVRGGPGAGFGRFDSGANEQVIGYLEANQGSDKYLVATANSNAAAPIILGTGKPVMSLGGFLGSDPILTSDDFADLVQGGVVRFVLAGGGFGRGNSSVMSWVQQNCVQVTEGGTQLYDCAATLS